MTITEAIKQVMHDFGAPMTVNEAYQAILNGKLYDFHSDNPLQIVRNQIRRHCDGLDFPSSAPTKYFSLVEKNKYWLLDKNEKVKKKSHLNKREKMDLPTHHHTVGSLQELMRLHNRYLIDLKSKILTDLKQISPSSFEIFAKRLLDIYGFHDTKVTQVNGDGGIDGYGKLKVGLANLNVAFQCKRWTKGNIQRPDAYSDEFDQPARF